MEETNMAHTLPTSEHFTLEEVADGVYAAIAIKGKGAFSNAGIIDLGGHTVIFDTFETSFAAQDLREAAESLTGHPATTVVISHRHNDHCFGNQVFADATIISTHKTREEMVASAPEIEKEMADTAGFEAFIRQQQEQLEVEIDERRRADIEHSISRWQYMLRSWSTLELVYPNLTFERRIILHGSQRTAKVITQGKGHTAGDCSLILSEERVAFIGDLAFFARQPFMVHGDPQAWAAQLEGFERSEIEVFVPGHGPVGAKADIALQREYILLLEIWVSQAIEKEEPVEEILKRPLPAPFDAWSIDGLPAEHNVRALYKRLAGEGQP
jgi:glyoxylase-like metal-dependent hydrolase (beta-lactamase superfamily II)